MNNDTSDLVSMPREPSDEMLRVLAGEPLTARGRDKARLIYYSLVAIAQQSARDGDLTVYTGWER